MGFTDGFVGKVISAVMHGDQVGGIQIPVGPKCFFRIGVDLLLWNQQKQGLLNFHQMLTKEPEKLNLSIIFYKK